MPAAIVSSRAWRLGIEHKAYSVARSAASVERIASPCGQFAAVYKHYLIGTPLGSFVLGTVVFSTCL